MWIRNKTHILTSYWGGAGEGGYYHILTIQVCAVGQVWFSSHFSGIGSTVVIIENWSRIGFHLTQSLTED